MECALPIAIPYPPPQLSGHFGGFVQNTNTMPDASVWIPKLNTLRGQRCYLEDLLAKTITKLNTLRDKQTRNERILSANPSYSRSKKKKISQNKWKTNKTIVTCESEERAILECLHVCRNNIDTLESMFSPAGHAGYFPPMAEYTSTDSYTGSDLCSGVQWNTGWTEDEDPFSPFETFGGGPMPFQEIAPEDGFGPGPVMDVVQYSATLPAHLQAHNVHPACMMSSQLSPKAAAFEPSSTNGRGKVENLVGQVDKLSLSGLLSSKSMKQQLYRRSFPDRPVMEQSASRLSSSLRRESTTDAHRRRSVLSGKGRQQSTQAQAADAIARTNSV